MVTTVKCPICGKIKKTYSKSFNCRGTPEHPHSGTRIPTEKYKVVETPEMGGDKPERKPARGEGEHRGVGKEDRRPIIRIE